ncbi:protein of unknown function - conserved [Leishmania donovani]|uniref:Uncharacterized protein n=3 Tax=Leishmania donovani species complex TaxID=38574 RepID=A4I4T5_LEIIN|nr:conserved hypothetical protein [Leishmania infantum JPCM5]TPP50641.1 hypothetical protein CGC20_24770 [Leishmania donovani]CAC9510515.1 hypothetical_protein_-_conserved [Leishmania infantum]CAJ1990752.1 protein of unknown function - conserved [Leishmania donovani]CAM69801.1 conserved hypothetical protein [Leishmania infantum JPCM5]SUZ43782.1 hypothetical_protein_-_conserved [Leishmania infantum]|eukprot:XP_001466754.1 conserved hypothetical protein [Leishmania infantum JPCM5]
MSIASRREEIQRQLQQLRDTRERELAAFDAVAAAHPELSATEITALAQKKAEAEVPQRISVGGVEVSVGARVSVKDDAHLLHRADRGYFAVDPLKAVYLGEQGQVMRVMKSFQGKPAVELRFADGVTKVFFVECLALSQESEDAGAGTSGHAAARHTDPTRGVKSVSSAKVLLLPPSPPQAEALPGWGHLRMPHRRPSAPLSAAVLPAFIPPPPPPTVQEARGTAAKRAAPTPARASSSFPAPAAPATSQAAEQPAKKAISETRKKPTAAVTTARPIVKKEPPRGPCRPSPALHVNSHPPTVKVDLAQPTLLPAVAMDAVFDEGLGSPLSCVMQDSVPRRTSTAADSEGIPDLRPTPGSSMCDIDALVDAETAADSAGAASAKAVCLHKACVTPNQILPDLRDEATTLTRRRSSTADSSGTRLCWLAGLTEPGGNLSEPLRISLQAQCTTMFAVFAVVTRKLRWDKQRLTATRLFTDKGVEIKSAGAVHDGMRLVATTGCAYRCDGVTSHFAAVGDARPSLTAPSRAAKTPCTRPTPAAASTAVAPAAISSSAPSTTASSSTPASPSRKAAVVPKQSNTATVSKRLAPSPLTAAKPIHIRVYENGLYDDNIYRTVTVRPTHKTLAALKTVITRELQWRDGKKVSLLFDASGTEVVELRDLLDGDAVVASAGDRFVIPYPNTAIHKEAVKLSERLC